jgi:hypothetical protein
MSGRLGRQGVQAVAGLIAEIGIEKLRKLIELAKDNKKEAFTKLCKELGIDPLYIDCFWEALRMSQGHHHGGPPAWGTTP